MTSWRLSTTTCAAQSRLTPAEVSAGVSPDPVKQTEIDVALDSLSRVLAERDSLQEELEKGTTELRATTTNVQADPTSAAPLGLTARLLLAIVLGLTFGSGLALGLHRFDTRLYGRKDAEAAFGLPVLAEIPKIHWLRRRSSQLIARSHPEAPASEAYRLLRSSLAQAARLLPGGPEASERVGTVVLVTSVSEGAGKSSTVANLAVAAVDARKQVLVVSADLRQPMIHTYLGAAPGPGLTDAVDRIEEDGIERVEFVDFLGATTVRGTTILRSGHPVPIRASGWLSHCPDRAGPAPLRPHHYRHAGDAPRQRRERDDRRRGPSRARRPSRFDHPRGSRVEPGDDRTPPGTGVRRGADRFQLRSPPTDEPVLAFEVRRHPEAGPPGHPAR
ncbi:MAG: hypothetical protein R2761_17040 [Acidimicrobiales bacterium]